MKNKYLFSIAGVIVTGLSIWYLFRSISAGDLIRALRAPNYWWLIPNLFFGFMAMWFQAMRWQTLVSPLKKVPLGEIFTATSIGLMINNIFPLRLGEFARVFVLNRRDRTLATSSLLATVLIERLIFDLGFLTLIILGVFYLMPLERQVDFGVSALIITIIPTIILVIIIVMAVAPQGTGNALSSLLFFIPSERRLSLEKTVTRFVGTVSLLNRRAINIKALALTAIIWLSMAISIYSLFLAFGFPLPLAASFVLLTAITLSMFLPSLPGYIGVFHLATVLTLNAYNIVGADARAFSIVIHLSQYIPTTLLGLFFFSRISLSLGSLRKNVMNERNLKSPKSEITD